MLEDLIRMTWGTAAFSTGGLYLSIWPGPLLGAIVPVYNLIVHCGPPRHRRADRLASDAHGLRPHHSCLADNREMAEALGVDMRWIYVRVFTLAPCWARSAAPRHPAHGRHEAQHGIGSSFVEAFAVVVHRKASGKHARRLRSARCRGSPSIGRESRLPELAMLPDLLIVIAVLLWRRGPLRSRGRVSEAVVPEPAWAWPCLGLPVVAVRPITSR